LNKDETVEVVFFINATGNIDNSYHFYANANITEDLVIGNETSVFNITIVSGAVANCDCPVSGDWVITEYCNLTTSCNVCPNIINITETGYLNISGTTIINTSEIYWAPADAEEEFRVEWRSPAQLIWGSCT